MTDLRPLLAEALALAEEATRIPEADNDRHEAIRARVDEIDAALASSPLLVSDALRDPEVRAGRVWVDAPAIGAKLRCTDGGWVQEDAGLGWRRWRPCASDLDSPCRLVPAEETP